MKKKMNIIGSIILIVCFLLFYVIANYFLGRNNDKKVIDNSNINVVDKNYDYEKNIVRNLYNQAKILYDVVNNKFKVSQDDTIVMGDITYKKIINFNEVMNNLFTDKGIDKYISDMGNYFAYTDNGYYLAGNLVSYQTYYFRGDETNIYILNANDNEINGIIYERWNSNNKNTLATVRLTNVMNRWLIDEINILATE